MIRRYAVIQRHPNATDTMKIVNDYYQYNYSEMHNINIRKCLRNKYNKFRNMIGVNCGKY